MTRKKSANGNGKSHGNASVAAEILDRIQGKESTFEMDFEKAGLKLGGERWLEATGTVRLSAVLLR